MKKIISIIFAAIMFYSTLIFSVDKTAEDFYQEGFKLYSSQNFELSIGEFENAVNLDADYFSLLTGNGFFETFLAKELSKESLEKTIKMCEYALNSKKNDEFFALYYKGWAQIKLGQKDEGKKNLEDAIKQMKNAGVNYDMASKLLTDNS